MSEFWCVFLFCFDGLYVDGSVELLDWWGGFFLVVRLGVLCYMEVWFDEVVFLFLEYCYCLWLVWGDEWGLFFLLIFLLFYFFDVIWLLRFLFFLGMFWIVKFWLGIIWLFGDFLFLVWWILKIYFDVFFFCLGVVSFFF